MTEGMKFITVDVTKEDIREGQKPTRFFLDKDHRYARSEQCPVALAVRRELPGAYLMPYGLISPGAGTRYYPYSRKAQEYIVQADRLHNTSKAFAIKPIRLRFRYE